MKKIFLTLTILFSIHGKSQVTFDPPINPNGQITLYILSQGYTATDMPEFNTFATNFISTLSTTVPFSELFSNFRIILVRDIATTTTFPRSFTQFGSAYDCYAGASSGSETYTAFVNRIDTFIANNIPAYNSKSYLLAIFNNDYYTGGGGKYTFATDYCNNPNYQTYMYNVLIHEFGHTFGLLGDEYGATAANVTPTSFPLFNNRNVTSEIVRANVPWNYLIAGSTAVPTCTFGNTCSSTVPGLYETANYANTGWYKPQNTCKMVSVTPAFCATCQDLLREKITEHLCIPNLTVSEQFLSRHQYITHWRKASTLLSSNSIIGNTISVNYLSGNSIVLTNGFSANIGSDFWGYIGDCNVVTVRNLYKTNNTSTPTPVIPPQKTNSNNLNEIKTIISPNPSSNLVSIDANGQLITNINLFSIDGKLLYLQKIGNQESFTLNISNYAKGTYIISIETDTGEIISKKLIKK